MNETLDTQTPETTDTTIDTTDTAQMPQLPPQPPQFNASQAPQFNASQAPQFNATQMPQFNATQMPQLPPPMFGQGFMAPPPDMSAWGNGEFNGEQLLNGENLTAHDDLSEITDATADISVNIGEQNGFGFPPAGMMPPFATDGGQLTDQSATTDTQAE